MQAVGIFGVFVLSGLIGVLIGQNREVSRAGAFIAGLFGILGWLLLAFSPKRPDDVTRPSSTDVASAALSGAAWLPFLLVMGSVPVVGTSLFLIVFGTNALVTGSNVEEGTRVLIGGTALLSAWALTFWWWQRSTDAKDRRTHEKYGDMSPEYRNHRCKEQNNADALTKMRKQGWVNWVKAGNHCPFCGRAE